MFKIHNCIEKVFVKLTSFRTNLQDYMQVHDE